MNYQNRGNQPDVEHDMINAISTADFAFIMSSSQAIVNWLNALDQSDFSQWVWCIIKYGSFNMKTVKVLVYLHCYNFYFLSLFYNKAKNWSTLGLIFKIKLKTTTLTASFRRHLSCSLGKRNRNVPICPMITPWSGYTDSHNQIWKIIISFFSF